MQSLMSEVHFMLKWICEAEELYNSIHFFNKNSILFHLNTSFIYMCVYIYYLYIYKMKLIFDTHASSSRFLSLQNEEKKGGGIIKTKWSKLYFEPQTIRRILI